MNLDPTFLTLENALYWRRAVNQQDYCDDLTGWDRTAPDYWKYMDLLEDGFQTLIEDDEQPVPDPAES
jgi:hypothetical protein